MFPYTSCARFPALTSGEDHSAGSMDEYEIVMSRVGSIRSDWNHAVHTGPSTDSSRESSLLLGGRPFLPAAETLVGCPDVVDVPSSVEETVWTRCICFPCKTLIAALLFPSDVIISYLRC